MKKQLYKKTTKHKKITPDFLFKLFLFLFVSYISKEEESNEIQTNYSYILLNVQGPGNMYIFYKNEENEN